MLFEITNQNLGGILGKGLCLFSLGLSRVINEISQARAIFPLKAKDMAGKSWGKNIGLKGVKYFSGKTRMGGEVWCCSWIYPLGRPKNTF
ncbi:MAG: hypothetical protein CM15mP12_3090 [Gammaproteobacteria bacterium]|nr:MAG: hypothetical protein CM15mP12_3090 [Gammaproteobacteria bacterium]